MVHNFLGVAKGVHCVLHAGLQSIEVSMIVEGLITSPESA